MKVELLAITPNSEALIEQAARTCYQTGDRIGPGSAATLLPKLIAAGHESPLEHAYATFRLSGVSRAMSHQLVRHRLLAVSQKSQRYVSEERFEYVTPPSLTPEQREEFARDMEILRGLYAKWRRQGLKNEDARFVLPNACTTELIISANFREFRHIFSVRCGPQAQWEIREVCRRMLSELHRHAPHVFGDLIDRFGIPVASPPQQLESTESRATGGNSP